MFTVTLLGTGTSTGIPMLTCSCPVCTSTDPHDQRTRTSALITIDGKNILVDVSTDFRQQALRHSIQHIDAVLCTHVHADHVFGMDDLRPFNERTRQAIPFYATARDIEELKDIFHHVFEPPLQLGGGLPKIDLNEMTVGRAFELFGVSIIPLEIQHGILPIVGYRIGEFAYLTDCSHIPESTYAQLKGVQVLVLDALRFRKHPTHFNVDEAVAAAQRIGARETYFIHIGHDLGHKETNAKLPPGIQLAYDGQEISLT